MNEENQKSLEPLDIDDNNPNLNVQWIFKHNIHSLKNNTEKKSIYKTQSLPFPRVLTNEYEIFSFSCFNLNCSKLLDSLDLKPQTFIIAQSIDSGFMPQSLFFLHGNCACHSFFCFCFCFPTNTYIRTYTRNTNHTQLFFTFTGIKLPLDITNLIAEFSDDILQVSVEYLLSLSLCLCLSLFLSFC